MLSASLHHWYIVIFCATWQIVPSMYCRDNEWLYESLYISKMYTESLKENYIFCVKSNIQVDNKSEQIILLCCLVFLIHSLSLSHTHTKAALMANGIWLNGSLSKATKKRCITLPEGLCIRETRRFVQMKCLVHRLCQRRKWLRFEMKSVMYFSHRGPLAISQSGGSSVALKVQFDQYLLKDVTLNWPVSDSNCLFRFLSYFLIYSGHFYTAVQTKTGFRPSMWLMF